MRWSRKTFWAIQVPLIGILLADFLELISLGPWWTGAGFMLFFLLMLVAPAPPMAIPEKQE